MIFQTGISCMDLVYVRVLVHNSMGTPAVKFNADTNTVDIVYKLPQRSKSTYEIVSKGTPTHNCEEENYKKEIKKRKSKKGNDKKRKDKKKKNKKKQDKHDYLLGIPDDDSTNTSQHDSNYEDSECDKITDFDDRKSKDSDENKKKYKKNDKNEDFDENKIKNSTEDKTKVSNEDKKADENSEDMDKDFGKKGTDEQKFQKKLRNRHRLKF